MNKEKSPRRLTGASYSSLTMSYFHTGIRTIIGAEAFHCPVRDGKEWDHLAMVIRLKQLPTCKHQFANGQFVESSIVFNNANHDSIALKLQEDWQNNYIDNGLVKVIGSSLTSN